MNRLLILFCLFVLFLPMSAFAEMKRLAVLDFRGVGIDQNTLYMFSDSSRAGVLQAIDGSVISVMTRENMAAVLRDNGIDIAECIGSCEVDIARKMQADYVLTGSVGKIGTEYVLTLKLLDTFSGNLLAVKEADSTSLNTLRKATSNLSRELIVEGLGGGSSGSENSRGGSGFVDSTDDDDWKPAGNSLGIVHFSSNPSGAIVRMDGKLLCQSTPCSKQIGLGGHKIVMEKERYKPETQTLNLKSSQKVDFRLTPDFGYLSVSSSISGVKILLDGKSIGKLPLSKKEVSKGSHVLSIQDPCYKGSDYHFSVSSGQTETVSDYPIKARVSAVQVSVSDRDGNAKSGKVYVDGKYLGTSPLTERVELCAKELVVEVDGKKTTKALSLKEKQTSEVDVVLGQGSSGGSSLEGNGYKAVLIPAGTFTMGCTSEQGSDCYDNEKPAHKVEISKDFYMMESEVTQGLYKRVMGENPSRFKGSNRPVEQVSWYDAVKFANKLSQQEGLEQCYSISGNNVKWSNKDCNGWRLPTEAEWERAARGGEYQYKYAGSNNMDSVGWYGSNSGDETHDVCGKAKNGYGLCDMSGNVYEWCWDWYDGTLYGSHADRGTVRDPYGTNSGSNRVRRGGCWYDIARGTRVSNRRGRLPVFEDGALGFRLGRTP